MPLPAIVIFKTVAAVAVFGITAFFAIARYKNRSLMDSHHNTYNNRNNNGGRNRDGATRSTPETSSMKSDTDGKSTRNASRLRKSPSFKANSDIPPKRHIRSRKNSLKNNQGTCSICLEDFDGTEIPLKCEHTFHYECAVDYLQESDCPLCKKIIPKQDTTSINKQKIHSR